MDDADSGSLGRWKFLFKALYIKDERKKGSLYNKINSYLEKGRNWPLQNIIFLTTNSTTVPVHSIQGMEKRCDVGNTQKEGIKKRN